MVLFKYGQSLTLAVINRRLHKRDERKDVLEKVTLIKDINIENPHRAHIEILFDLSFSELLKKHKFTNFVDLHNAWQKTLSLSVLNEKFYKDLQGWFYYAAQNIKLPFKPEYINEKENIKNFLVRLLARTMFCWFVKEKGLITSELFELTDWADNKYPITYDIDSEDFLQSNSYYRGILQNVFFNALNQKEKKTPKDFKWTKYLHPSFNFDWFTAIPFLNGGIFDKLEEDNAKESIEDSVIKVPNFLFYGDKGLNGIFKSYKFTLEENTPFEEDVALDPELLGLVFENLLAELDPNLEESVTKSIRKLTGSYYTPRNVIQEMVNESLFIYLSKYIKKNHPNLQYAKEKLSKLIYQNIADTTNQEFCLAILTALDKFRVLDPACGSGAFLMGMLHRMVDILKLVDTDNQFWLELKLKTVDPAQRIEFTKILTQHLDDYSRKLGIIRDSIYGIDIQPLAVQITKLRFFISLLIDQRTEKGITPMPNIETKIICANSLKDIRLTGLDMIFETAIANLHAARLRYYQPDLNHEEREEIIAEIVKILDSAFPSFSQQITGKQISGQNKALLKEWFTHATIAAPFFNMDSFYPELKESGGFDCVIGNPPYGGTKISDEVRTALGIESKDPYGAFIARFLNTGTSPTPLKHGGVLAFIVSDTFMTIKSHLKLRNLMMQNYIHKMLRVHPDTFRATVNAAIIICERNVYPKDKDGEYIPTFNANHICQMADLTNISIHDNHDRFVEVLHQTEGVDFVETDTRKAVSNPEYAIYYYLQSLIATNSNLPFFVASPKLFALMNDSGKNLKKEWEEIGGKKVQVRIIEMNDKPVKVVKLGDIAEIKQGLTSGDNYRFLFQNVNARGNYQNIDDYKELLLTEKDFDKIRNDEKLRLEVIEKGFSKDNKNSIRYFSGRYIVPYDKGGESDAEGGWMPNYYVPTEYYFDWSEESINELIKRSNYPSGKSGKTFWRNKNYYFKDGLSYSFRGFYSPTFRFNSFGAIDVNGPCIFLNVDGDLIDGLYEIIQILASKIFKYLFKTSIQHTVASDAEPLGDTSIPYPLDAFFHSLVDNIITKQKTNPRYDYASHEQIEIDRLVYEAYGLNAEDIEEVENWYARRYPKLSAAQKVNLRKLGKSDDYLVLYGYKKE
jgi:hypothetical protein